MNQNPLSNKTQVIIVATLLGFGVIALIVLLLFMFRRNDPAVAIPATQTPPIPTIFAPTPDCGSSTLLLGTSTFQIQNLTPSADGSFNVPSDTSGIAYWVEGTNTKSVFIVSPTPENATIMSTISVGSGAKLTWTNCNSSTYNLNAPQASSLDIPVLSDQSVEGITIFFQTAETGAGFVFHGDLTEQQINTINTPDISEVQAEISLLETSSSQDGTSLRIGVSIQNNGALPITVSASDIALVQADSAPLVMAGSEPALPIEIVPGATETIYITFPRPATPTATLKVFTVEYDIEGY